MDGRFRLGVFVVLLGIGVGCIGPERSAVEVRPPAPDPNVKCDGQKTLQYWNSLAAILGTRPKVTVEEFASIRTAGARALRQQAREIEELPLLDIDPGLLFLAGRYVRNLKQAARGIESFYWYHCLGWPLPADLVAANSDAEDVKAECNKLRATLVERYHLEFPLITFPVEP